MNKFSTKFITFFERVKSVLAFKELIRFNFRHLSFFVDILFSFSFSVGTVTSTVTSQCTQPCTVKGALVNKFDFDTLKFMVPADNPYEVTAYITSKKSANGIHGNNKETEIVYKEFDYNQCAILKSSPTF